MGIRFWGQKSVEFGVGGFKTVECEGRKEGLWASPLFRALFFCRLAMRGKRLENEVEIAG